MITISAVINCYNEGELILNALNSLYAQTDRDFTIILVNDCSPDETTNRVCKEIESSNKVELIWNDVNKGHGVSRNVAFENMTTEVAVFLDADDTLPPNAIATIRNCFNLQPEADFVYGNYELHNIEENTYEIVDCSVITNKQGWLSPFLLANNWRLVGSSPCKKSLFQKTGGYDPVYSNTTNDVDFWQRAILAGAKGYYINDSIYNYNRSIQGINLSPAFLKAMESCYYKNIDFIILYSNIYKEGFNLALKNNNYHKIKEWAIHEIRVKKNHTLFAIVFYFCPMFLLRILSKTYLVAKRLLK
jgi:glycosyltransferase involved in cell wall biosynthesis